MGESMHQHFFGINLGGYCIYQSLVYLYWLPFLIFIYWLLEREEGREKHQFLCVPWPEIKPASLVYRNDAPTNWATWPGLSLVMLAYVMLFVKTGNSYFYNCLPHVYFSPTATESTPHPWNVQSHFRMHQRLWSAGHLQEHKWLPQLVSTDLTGFPLKPTLVFITLKNTVFLTVLLTIK